MLAAQISRSFILLFLAIFLTSCEEHKKLFSEKASLEGELAAQRQQQAELERKTGSLGIHPFVAATDLEQRTIVTNTECDGLTKELTELSGKTATVERALADFRAKLSTFQNAHSK